MYIIEYTYIHSYIYYIYTSIHTIPYIPISLIPNIPTPMYFLQLPYIQYNIYNNNTFIVLHGIVYIILFSIDYNATAFFLFSVYLIFSLSSRKDRMRLASLMPDIYAPCTVPRLSTLMASEA